MIKIILILAISIGAGQVRCTILSTASLIASIGYNAKNHTFISDGYMLSLVQATNPKVNHSALPHKIPVLFVPGFLMSPKAYLINAPQDVEAQNWSFMNASEMTPDELEEGIVREPASKCLVSALLNFGHEVWFLNTRSTRESRDLNKHKNQASTFDLSLENLDLSKIFEPFEEDSEGVNPSYWNYTYDEQALHDIPKAVDVVLRKTGHKKLSLLGISGGGALILFSLSRVPELSSKSKWNI